MNEKPEVKRAAKPRKGRRAKGTGTIFPKPDGGWMGRKKVGTRPDGKPLLVERHGKTQAEVVAKLAAAGPPGEAATVGELVTRHLAKPPARKGTARTYLGSMERMRGYPVWSVKARDLTPGKVEQFARELADDGYKPGTVRMTLALLRAVLAAAVRNGTLPANPAAAARGPKQPRQKIDPLTRGEVAAVIAGAAAAPPAWPLAVMAGTGCRVGECLALDVGDYDPLTARLSITKTYSQRDGMGPPKSENGVRTIRIPARVRPVVEAAAAGRPKGEPLFPTSTGRRRSLTGVTDAWDALCKRLGLRRRNPHQLRHTFASHALAGGHGIPDVAAYLGDSPVVILKTYGHATGADVSAWVDDIDGD